MALAWLPLAHVAVCPAAEPNASAGQQIIQASRDSRSLGKLLSTVFAPLGESHLAALTQDSNHTVAINAYVEYVKRVSTAAPDGEHNKNGRTLGKDVCYRTAGFVAGRIGVPVPKWWEDSLQINNYSDPTNYGMLETATGDVFYFSNGLHLAETAGAMALSVDDIKIEVAVADVRRFADGIRNNRLTAVSDNRNIYVLFYSMAGSKAKLVAFARDRKGALWESDIWCLGIDNLEVITGTWEHRAMLRLGKQSVVVFGAGTGGSYVEAVNTQSGKNVGRYCRDLWFAIE